MMRRFACTGLLFAATAFLAGLAGAAEEAHHPPPHHPPHHQPPPEAFAACKDLSADASCTVEIGGHSIEGTCRSGPDGKGALACAPKGPPPRE